LHLLTRQPKTTAPLDHPDPLHNAKHASFLSSFLYMMNKRRAG
jgi:hypothetical protein